MLHPPKSQYFRAGSRRWAKLALTSVRAHTHTHTHTQAVYSQARTWWPGDKDGERESAPVPLSMLAPSAQVSVLQGGLRPMGKLTDLRRHLGVHTSSVLSGTHGARLGRTEVPPPSLSRDFTLVFTERACVRMRGGKGVKL